MDIRKVKKLIEMLEESNIAEIEIHEGEESVRVSRVGPHAPVAVDMRSPTPVAAAPVAAPAAGIEGVVPAAPQYDGHVVKAPMVGIFYESSAPGKPPFVELGKKVGRGEILCVIEAMKILNQIEADTSGVVTQVLVGNGEPVEYGQPLFVIRPD
jgi:acetyl-CoA carboxylase biotin carboxyl carrier protein